MTNNSDGQSNIKITPDPKRIGSGVTLYRRTKKDAGFVACEFNKNK